MTYLDGDEMARSDDEHVAELVVNERAQRHDNLPIGSDSGLETGDSGDGRGG